MHCTVRRVLSNWLLRLLAALRHTTHVCAADLVAAMLMELPRQTSRRGGKDLASGWASACDFSWNCYRPCWSAVSAGCGQQHRLLHEAIGSGQGTMNEILVLLAQRELLLWPECSP